MKVSEVAERCGVSVQAVREYCRSHFDVSKKGSSGWNLTEDDAREIIDYYANEKVGSARAVGESAKGKERKAGESFVSVPLETLAALEELRAQLRVKDEQIADLSASLKAAHDSLRAAQALHGADVLPKTIEAGMVGGKDEETDMETATEPEQKRPTRWQYFKAVFTGIVE